MPRFVYWTILLGSEPTAFRAKEREELVATLVQLRRHHPEAVLKWVERGQVWDSPEQAREARERAREEASRRPPTWRPGGEHRDPRERYKAPRDVKRAKLARKFGWKKHPDAPGGARDEHGRIPWAPKPEGGAVPRRQPPHDDRRSGRDDRVRADAPSRAPGQQRPSWKDRPAGEPRPPRSVRDDRGKIPWSPKPAGRPPREERPAAGRSPREDRPAGGFRPRDDRRGPGDRRREGGPPWGQRPPRPDQVPRGGKPWGSRPEGGNRPPAGRKPSGGQSPRGDRPGGPGPRPPRRDNRESPGERNRAHVDRPQPRRDRPRPSAAPPKRRKP